MNFTTEKTNELNKSRLDVICPSVAERCKRLLSLASDEGFSLLVTQGLRTFAEQDALFAQGRTRRGKIVTNARGGQSWHNYGLAADFCFITNGEPDWSDKLYKRIGVWSAVVGLEWGGRWKTITDLPHCQLIKGMKTADALALYKKGGVKAVWEKIK